MADKKINTQRLAEITARVKDGKHLTDEETRLYMEHVLEFDQQTINFILSGAPEENGKLNIVY